jgi:hypothetical protein
MNALLAETALRLLLLIVTEYSKHQKHQGDSHKNPCPDHQGETVPHL